MWGQRFDFFRFSATDAEFQAIDEESRKKGMQKLMRVLATERLKDQVNTLERNLSNLNTLSCPIVVLDVDCYVDHLRLVKNWLMTQACMIVIPSDVIDSLDRIKKGTDLTNVRAREAIRYLEQRFRFRTSHLRAQGPDEHLEAWDASGRCHVDSPDPVVVPRYLRPVLACCLHIQAGAAPVEFALVTDNEEMAAMAVEVGVAVVGVREWAAKMDRGVRVGRRRGGGGGARVR
ncbi:hypothetical protein BDK51DRAFT_25867 [Blyttiomyces helicus]|uniref:PIN domain-containing protein n=1 Tax=Blyttiomyces helicus TaxID=388810 RepID=A0A4P9WCK9_9FUNG|nr:hypothetical protein BDK51DRAFT_25867 [Blyttiomyces helicus]|eukprot:RKO89343.1 hypothetical protein BDK51DRAFT_25867 [Blyttiomyces helicus]